MRTFVAHLIVVLLPGAFGCNGGGSGVHAADGAGGGDKDGTAEVTPDANSDPSGNPTCAGLFDCMVVRCQLPPPPPPSSVPWPPPKLPDGAGVGCLDVCAREVYGPERPAALELADCAQKQCAKPVCESSTPANQCLETCIWDHCAEQLALCGRGPVAQKARCRSGLTCMQTMATGSGLGALLACFSGQSATSMPLLQAAVACVELDGPSAPQCAVPLETCACDTAAGAKTAGDAACLAVLSSCHLGGPCGRQMCRQGLSQDSRKLADPLLDCLNQQCGHCKDAACQATCMQNKCGASMAGCLMDRCAADRAGKGTGTCQAGVQCLAKCEGSDDACCLSACSAAMNGPSRATATTWLACGLRECGCLGSSDGLVACLENCAACADEKLMCSKSVP